MTASPLTAWAFIPARVSGAALPSEIFALPVWLTSAQRHAGAYRAAPSPVQSGDAGIRGPPGRAGDRRAADAAGLCGRRLCRGVRAVAARSRSDRPDGGRERRGIGADRRLFDPVQPIAGARDRADPRRLRPHHLADRGPGRSSTTWSRCSRWGAAIRSPWEAHVGGFVAGVAMARPLLRWRWRKA